jgi:hypothetical protein
LSNCTTAISSPPDPLQEIAGANSRAFETNETEFACAEDRSRQETIPFPTAKAEPKAAETFHPEHQVRAVAGVADELFPTRDFGSKVWSVEASVDLEILEASLHDAKRTGKWDWDYITGIYRKRCADGRMAKMANPETRSVLKRPSVSTRPPLMSPEIRRELAERDARLAAERRQAR